MRSSALTVMVGKLVHGVFLKIIVTSLMQRLEYCEFYMRLATIAVTLDVL